jgi:hypothetical protein
MSTPIELRNARAEIDAFRIDLEPRAHPVCDALLQER